MTPSTKIAHDKAVGCLLGLVLGDDNGGPTAMMLKNLDTVVSTRNI